MMSNDFVYGTSMFVLGVVFSVLAAFASFPTSSIRFADHCKELNGVVIGDYCVKGTAIVEKKL